MVVVAGLFFADAKVKQENFVEFSKNAYAITRSWIRKPPDLDPPQLQGGGGQTNVHSHMEKVMDILSKTKKLKYLTKFKYTNCTNFQRI